MRKLLLTIIILSTVFCRIPKRYNIDVYQPLEPQYKKIFSDFKTPIKNYLEYAKAIPHYSILRTIAGIFTLFQSRKVKERISMFARVSNISESDVILINLSYEVLCTSIVLRNDQNEVFIGRNLDFDGANVLAPLSYEYTYLRNGTQIFTGASIVGCIGVLNAVVPGKFTVSINQRTSSTGIRNLLRGALGYKNPLFYLQEIVENAGSYSEAVRMMVNDKLSAPCYYIISGVKPDEGAVITRDWNGAVAYETLDNDKWFLVQTNYDRDQEDPEYDYRRIPAEKKIAAIGRNITRQVLYDEVLLQRPNNVFGETIYTTLQSANSTYFNTTVYEEF